MGKKKNKFRPLSESEVSSYVNLNGSLVPSPSHANETNRNRWLGTTKEKVAGSGHGRSGKGNIIWSRGDNYSSGGDPKKAAKLFDDWDDSDDSDDSLCRRIHGFGSYGTSDSGESSGESDFDERHERMRPRAVKIDPDIDQIIVISKTEDEENAVQSFGGTEILAGETSELELDDSSRLLADSASVISLDKIRLHGTEEQDMETKENHGLNERPCQDNVDWNESQEAFSQVKESDASEVEAASSKTKKKKKKNRNKKNAQLAIESQKGEEKQEEQATKDKPIDEEDLEEDLVSTTLKLLEMYCNSNNIFGVENAVALLRIVQRIGIEKTLCYISNYLGCKDEASKLRFVRMMTLSVDTTTVAQDEECNNSEVMRIFQILDRFNQETPRKSLQESMDKRRDQCFLDFAKRKMSELLHRAIRDHEFCILIVVSIFVRWFLPNVFNVIVGCFAADILMIMLIVSVILFIFLCCKFVVNS